MYLWLVVAFVVDGIDGPLARRYDVKTYAPQFDGVLLDLIIDYLTYVFIPAFALFRQRAAGGLDRLASRSSSSPSPAPCISRTRG